MALDENLLVKATCRCPGDCVRRQPGPQYALVGGVVGILMGAWLFAALYPKLEGSMLHKGDFGELSFPRLLKANAWIVVIPAVLVLVCFLLMLERVGL